MTQLRRFGLLSLTALAGIGLVAHAPVSAADKKAAADKPADVKYTIEEAMEKIHKGKDKSVFAQVVAGKGSAEQKHLIVEGYESMLAQKPPKGDMEDWKKRVGNVLTAAKAVEGDEKGDKKTLAALKGAANCKQCHDLHQDK